MGIERQVPLIDAVQPPSGGGLGGVDTDDAIGLNARHPWVVCKRYSLARRQLGCKTVEGMGEHGERYNASTARKRVGLFICGDCDDVAIWNDGANLGTRGHSGNLGRGEGIGLVVVVSNDYNP